MSKNKRPRGKKTADPAARQQSVTLTWNLRDLPTAQHKAGLAGLVLAVRSLAERSRKDGRSDDETPVIVGDVGVDHVTIRFTEASTQRLMDDLYDAAFVEVRIKSKWPGTTPKREELVPEVDPKTQKSKDVRRFVYDVCQPKATALQAWYPVMDDQVGWIKLWRDMLWNIPRANPQSRQPFEDRAESKPCREGPAAWKTLSQAAEELAAGGVTAAAVSSSLWLGSQAVNAEGVPFLGRIDQNFLLHFWPICGMVFVPNLIDSQAKSEFVGYVLAVPEVSDLDYFCARWPETLSSLETKVRGYRPARAVIDIPAQGALELMNAVATLVTTRQDSMGVPGIASVEFLHLDKQGNNVKLLASGRVPADRRLLRGYDHIVGTGADGKPRFGNPIFKSALILALLRGKPWWGELLPQFMTRDWRFFVNASDTREIATEIARLSWFWADVREQLHDEFNAWKRETENAMEGETVQPRLLQHLINQLVRTYVRARAEARSGVTLTEPVDWKNLPKPFTDEKEKVAQSLFLEFRSRREQAFVQHFAQTFFATKQYLRDEDQATLAQAISLVPLDDRDDVVSRIDNIKTLTLMALSANS